MIVEFDASFLKSIQRVRDVSIKEKIRKAIEHLELTADLNEIAQIKK